ncbi:27358_t:CDS:1 [Racocetra persica]|uniref:27358_t:CDS:1 n=1 Tax=Racocetra persica TaxID=160502 RepID=A0ACA9P1L3_9GLOM|nr:27358_t:CDS:1 [Racocetra persica]
MLYNNTNNNSNGNENSTEILTKTNTQTPTTTPACCQSRGSPGWNNEIHYSCTNSSSFNSSTPQNCCNSCVANPNCLGWGFSKNNTQCFQCNGNVDNYCSSAKIDPSTIGGEGSEGGTIRCSDGSKC